MLRDLQLRHRHGAGRRRRRRGRADRRCWPRPARRVCRIGSVVAGRRSRPGASCGTARARHGPTARRRPDLGRRLEPAGADRRGGASPATRPRSCSCCRNRPKPPGSSGARRAGIAPSRSTTARSARPRGASRPRSRRRSRAGGAELVCLAGFMRLLTRGFVDAWRGRMLNIHPSLLPAFRGLAHPRPRARRRRARSTAARSTWSRSELDEGPMLAQGVVPVLDGDTEESLAARVLRGRAPLLPAGAGAARVRPRAGGRRAPASDGRGRGRAAGAALAASGAAGGARGRGRRGFGPQRIVVDRVTARPQACRCRRSTGRPHGRASCRPEGVQPVLSAPAR